MTNVNTTVDVDMIDAELAVPGTTRGDAADRTNDSELEASITRTVVTSDSGLAVPTPTTTSTVEFALTFASRSTFS